MIYKIIVLISLLAVISASDSEKNNSIDKDILENDVNKNKNPSKRGVFYHGHGLYPEAYSSSSYYGYQIPNVGGQIFNKPLLSSSSRPVAFSAPAGFGASIHYANSPAIFGNSIAPIHTHPASAHFGIPAHPAPVHFGVSAQHSPVHFGVPAHPASVHFGVPAHPAPVHFGLPANPAPVHFGVPAHTAPVHFGVPAHPVAAIPPIAPTQYAIRPGGAIVQSYNVNYPQLQYHHKHYPTYPFVGVPAPAAIAPAAAVVPVNNLHYQPTFAGSPAHVGFSFPPVASLPPPSPPVAQFAPQHFFVNRPPAIGVQFAAAPLPTPVVPQRPAFVTFGSPSPTLGTFPSVIPIPSGSAIAPAQIPAATPVSPTIPTTLATPWRPIFINNSPTTTATPQPVGSAGNRPPISLLPPYGIAEKPNEDFSHYYNAQNLQNQQELTEQNYYAPESANKGYNY